MRPVAIGLLAAALLALGPPVAAFSVAGPPFAGLVDLASGSAEIRAANCSVGLRTIDGIEHRITICPASGPVGTKVSGSGLGCANVIGHKPIFVLYTASYFGTPGFLGADMVDDVNVSTDGTFKFEYVIPAELGTVQGYGGGATQAGDYAFSSKPGICVAPFRITGLPSTSTAPESDQMIESDATRSPVSDLRDETP